MTLPWKSVKVTSEVQVSPFFPVFLYSESPDQLQRITYSSWMTPGGLGPVQGLPPGPSGSDYLANPGGCSSRGARWLEVTNPTRRELPPDVTPEDAALNGPNHLLSVGAVGEQDVPEVLLNPVHEVRDEDHVVATVIDISAGPIRYDA